MTQPRDIERLLDMWLSDGSSVAPDRVLDVVADRIERQPQRTAWRLDWRHPSMNPFMKAGAAIAAVIVIALVGYNLLPGSPGFGGVGPTPAPAVTAAPTPIPSPTPAASASPAKITLRVGTIESTTSPATRALRSFADEVARVTNGEVSVDITVQAVPEVESREEHALVAKLRSGAFDIALIPTRAWGAEGVPSFHPTMVPMLIDSDRLAAAVARDPIAATMLDGLSAVGLKGLAMWPEDLRHPVSFGTPFLTPSSFTGTGIRALPSDVTTSMIAALGGHAVDVKGDPYDAGVADGSIGGAESGLQNSASLPRPGTYTANVTFYPRMDVLAIRPEALAGLTQGQSDAIFAAAQTTTQHVTDTNPTDAESAQAYCSAGGHIAVANAAQLALFTAAVKPVADDLVKEPLTKTVVDRINQMKASLPPPDAVTACGS